MKQHCNINGKIIEFNICSRSKDTIINDNTNENIKRKYEYIGKGCIVGRELEGKYHFWLYRFNKYKKGIK